MKEQADEKLRTDKDDQEDAGGRYRAQVSSLKRVLCDSNKRAEDFRAEAIEERTTRLQAQKRMKAAEKEVKDLKRAYKILQKENNRLRLQHMAPGSAKKTKPTAKKASRSPQKLKCCAGGCNKEVNGDSPLAHSWKRCGKCGEHRCNKHTGTAGDFPCK